MTHALLESFVEQFRGLKLDVLKILRNPYAAFKEEDGTAKFIMNETVLKIERVEPVEEEKKDDVAKK